MRLSERQSKASSEIPADGTIFFNRPKPEILCECGWHRVCRSHAECVRQWYAHLDAGECAYYLESQGQRNLFQEKKEDMALINRKRYAGDPILRTTDFTDGKEYTIDWFQEISTQLKDRPVQPAVRLNGFDKFLPLNTTNLDTCLAAFGDDDEKWKGQKIKIRIVQTNTPGGAATDGIRIEIPKAKKS